MKRDKKEINGYTYYEMYISCPEHHVRGISSPQVFCIHENCKGHMYIGSNANVRCNQCGEESRVDNRSMWCGGGEDVIFMSCTRTKKLNQSEALNIAGQIVSFTGVNWLKNYLEHLEAF